MRSENHPTAALVFLHGRLVGVLCESLPVGDDEKAANETTGETEDESGGRSLSALLDDVVRSERTAGIVSSVEQTISRWRRERKVGKGTLRATHITAYRGYVANGRAAIRFRVIEQPVVPAQAEALTDPELLKMNMRRFFALSFPGVHVKVTLDQATDEAVTARHGFATVQLPVGDVEPGWHDYTAVTVPVDESEEVATARSQVLAPDPSAPVWVVSDIDDTVLQTGLAEGLTAMKNTFLGQARTRRAVPGMATLYRALEGAGPSGSRVPFFYLSTGSWAFYDMLIEFLRVRGFPDGPLFLTDWAPQERYITRSGTEHKRTNLRRLFQTYPEAKFILVGDSGQRDPYNYTDLAREFPNSVARILILDVGREDKAEEVREFAATMTADDPPFSLVADAGEAAEVLAEAGLIDEAAVTAVRASVERGSEGDGD